MNLSSQVKSTCLAVPSPTAAHIAYLSGTQLEIQCLTSLTIIRSISLPAGHDVKKSTIVWSPATLSSKSTFSPSTLTRPSRHVPPAHSNRVCIFDEDTTRVYDLRDEDWKSVISNGSGGLGKNVHVEFGASEDEVLVWCDFTACLKIWCLRTGKAVEIRDPKFPGRDSRGWGFRPKSSSRRAEGEEEEEEGPLPPVFALLCRHAGTDILLLLLLHLASSTYEIISRVDLPTNDAAGLKWSRDGRWLAVWDAASAGYRLCIYTADGHLYRTVTRAPLEESNEWEVEGLGIKTVDWVPEGDWISVGDWDGRVRMLSTKTFSSVGFLDHTNVFNATDVSVYSEVVEGQGHRSYTIAQQPVTLPKTPNEKNDMGVMKQGISILAFNATGTLCATREDSMSSTLWIWDLKRFKPSMILVQYAPVRSAQWHPNDPTRLLFQTVQDSPVVYLCTADRLPGLGLPFNSATSPDILAFHNHIDKHTGPGLAKWTTTWLATPAEKKPMFLLGHAQAHILVWPDGKDPILRFDSQAGEPSTADNDNDDDNDDSLFEILTGRTHTFPLLPNPAISHQSTSLADSRHLHAVEREAGTSQEMDPDDALLEVESGLDEMF